MSQLKRIIQCNRSQTLESIAVDIAAQFTTSPNQDQIYSITSMLHKYFNVFMTNPHNKVILVEKHKTRKKNG